MLGERRRSRERGGYVAYKIANCRIVKFLEAVPKYIAVLGITCQSHGDLFYKIK